jgi:uncharacterized membrane protein YhaH (DUF805 family)
LTAAPACDTHPVDGRISQQAVIRAGGDAGWLSRAQPVTANDRDWRSLLRFAAKPFRDCFRFSGRSTRSEVGMFCFVWSGLSALGENFLYPHDAPFAGPSTLEICYALLLALPVVSLSVRRLHDQDKSAWWMLVPAAAVIVFVISTLLPQSPGGEHFNLLAWNSYPDEGSPASFLVSLLYTALMIAMATLSLFPPSPGTNRFGANPRPEAAPPADADREPAA